ncbi:MAG TPA: aminotransferase class IV [Acidimicrobiia bacterium]
MTTTILINGQPSDGRIPVTDSSVLRGDAVFEVIKVYDGALFRLDDHIDRLESSARKLQINLPRRSLLADWMTRAAEEVQDGVVRVVATRGSSVPGEPGEPLVIVFGHGWDRPDAPCRLFPMTAPWHAAGAPWELAGAKLTSYAPNMASTRRAQAEGFDDALLLSTDGIVLEGPTFSVAWVIDGVLETPGLGLGILDSITRRVALELANAEGIAVEEVEAPLQRMLEAEEAMVWSTVREVHPVCAVGDHGYETGPITKTLQEAFSAHVGNPG